MKKSPIAFILGSLLFAGATTSHASTEQVTQPTAVMVDQGVAVVSAQEVLELRESINNAQDGDVISIKPGRYADLGRVTLSANNVKIVAQEPGTAIFNGSTQFLIKGDNNLIESLVFTDGGATLSTESHDANIMGVFGIFGKNNTLNNSVIYKFNDYEYVADEKGKYPNIRWITVGGENNKITNNTFEGKYKRGAMLVVATSDKLEKTLIEGNIFKDLTALDMELIENSNPKMVRTNRNDRQAIRVGDSHNSLFESQSIIRNNYFDNISGYVGKNGSGEIELISVKASGITFDGNTIKNSTSMISLRHGHNNVVTNNVILPGNTANSGGIRIYDENHVIENNYIEGTLGKGTYRGALVLNTGIIDVANGEVLSKDSTDGKTLQKQWTPKDVVVKNNTLVNNTQGIFASNAIHRVSLTNDERVETIFPAVDTLFENNLSIATEDGTNAFRQFEGEKFQMVGSKFVNNIFYGQIEGLDQLPKGVSTDTPAMERDEQGLLKAVGTVGASNLTVLNEEMVGSSIVIN
ncbi:polysaccharide lyase 6 family protein [Vibrio agarivorans]|uniref:polysaccharide lyase 6 family protein n=1 Tax=Vibrio agarivorans TaxID=153622 RepID=UPI0025B52C29|nr:polysaccharide lyase 6 family protein [Vibrio agarivorans]MDN3663543.1 polysaccharide lyase 6 family protein [Vibrio agarivorans]